MAGLWTPESLRRRHLLLLRAISWCKREGIPFSPETATLWVNATGVSIQARLTYAKVLSGTLKHLGFDTQPLRSLMSALNAQGASIPMHQAPPMPRQRLLAWAVSQEPRTRLACLIAWKTASRWSEVAGLTWRHFIRVTPTEIVIDWKTLPKARRSNPFTASRFTVIKGPLTEAICTLLLSTVLRRRTLPLCGLTTTDIDAMWKSESAMSEYSAHSVKRGAITHLTEIAEARQIPGNLISRLAKHKTGRNDSDIAEMSIRYGGNPIALARFLKTGMVTSHL